MVDIEILHHDSIKDTYCDHVLKDSVQIGIEHFRNSQEFYKNCVTKFIYPPLLEMYRVLGDIANPNQTIIELLTGSIRRGCNLMGNILLSRPKGDFLRNSIGVKLNDGRPLLKGYHFMGLFKDMIVSEKLEYPSSEEQILRHLHTVLIIPGEQLTLEMIPQISPSAKWYELRLHHLKAYTYDTFNSLFLNEKPHLKESALLNGFNDIENYANRLNREWEATKSLAFAQK